MGLAGEHTIRKKTKPSPHTINRENMVLRDILKHAYEKKFINTIPIIKNNYDDKSPMPNFNAEEWTYMLKRFDEDIARSKKDKFQRFTDLTPQKFYKEHVGIDLDDFVCLINDPRSFTEYNKTYTVEYLGNVSGGNIIRYLNLETDELRKYTIKSMS